MNIVVDDDDKVLPNKANTQKFQNTDTAFMLDSNQNPDLQNEFFVNQNHQRSEYSEADGSETSEEEFD